MPGSRRRLIAVAAGAVAIAAALAAARVFVLGPYPLGPGTVGTTTSAEGRVGEHRTFCAGAFDPRGSRPVHVRSVHLTGVPRGLRVVGIWGIESGHVNCEFNSDPDPSVRARLRPVTDMVYRPGSPEEEWQLVIVLAATEPGEWTTTGLDIAWSAGWRRGTSHYKYRFAIRATA